MKMKPGHRRAQAHSTPLPIAILIGFGFFFAGYYVSLARRELSLDLKPEETENHEKRTDRDFHLTDSTFDRNAQEAQRKQLLESGLEFAFQHGETGEDTINDIPYQILSWKPRALLFPNFVSSGDCEHIVELAKSRLSPSGLALRQGETDDTTKNIRTSSGTFLSASNDRSGTLTRWEDKIAKATMIPQENGEAFNILRYQIGQKYDSHYDVFNPAEYGPQKSQRMASMLLYLSNVEEGGETMFPYENYENMKSGYDFKSCKGLKVKPRQGDALLFYSLHPNGTFDAAALHGSCPVIQGEKWVATKWLRDHPEF